MKIIVYSIFAIIYIGMLIGIGFIDVSVGGKIVLFLIMFVGMTGPMMAGSNFVLNKLAKDPNDTTKSSKTTSSHKTGSRAERYEERE